LENIEFLEKSCYNIVKCLLWKDYPNGPWKNHINPRELLKGGCHMIINGIKALVNSIKFTGITINIGFIGLNFAGGSSKANIF
jgi:hypothetical protein